jgi:transcriptional regulator of arginine metabolism
MIMQCDGYLFIMSKAARQKAILELLHKGPIESQEELQGFLAKRGFEAGQATLSRDIRELGLVKTYDGYMPANDVSGAPEPVLPSVSRLVREFVVEVRLAQNLLVLKTSVGSAQPVAASMDAEDWPEVVGTLGGDDTILVISQDNKTAQQLARRIEGMLA